VRTLVLAVTLLIAGRTAEAASGAVFAKVLFYQNNNDYCPTTQDCTAANYLQSQYNTYQPFANAKVFMEDANGNLIGQSSVAADGYFTMNWFSSSLPSNARIYVRPFHKDDRFRFYLASGASYKFQFPTFTPINGTTLNGTAQDLGTYTLGTAASPSVYANVFDGAQRMWNDALRYSSDMVNNFNDVEIRAFGNDSECSSSCTSGTLIKLDSGATYVLSRRILHEMGHVVSSTAKAWGTNADYCYDSPGAASCGWNFTTQEWKSRSFEEGIATFFGDVTLYWYWANNPVINGVSRENQTTTCASGQSRWAESVLRYVWDVYDSHADTGWTDDTQYSYDTIVEALQKFCDGTGDHSVNEGQVNKDGRSSSDFAYNLGLINGDSTPTERARNCVD
jgi:hypothetical protein